MPAKSTGSRAQVSQLNPQQALRSAFPMTNDLLLSEATLKRMEYRRWTYWQLSRVLDRRLGEGFYQFVSSAAGGAQEML